MGEETAGQQLKRLREGIPIDILAAASGCSVEMLTLIEEDMRECPVRTAEKITHAVDVLRIGVTRYV